MADLRPQHTEEIVGHGHATKADVASRAWNVEHDVDGTHKSMVGMPSGTVIVGFGQSSAPTGWTKKADWQDQSMIVYTTGNIAQGGAVDAKATHTHTGPSHTHTGPSHQHGAFTLTTPKIPAHAHPIDLHLAAGVNVEAAIGDGAYWNVVNSGLAGGGGSHQHTAAGTGNTGADGTGNTGANTASRYCSVIAATKD